MGILITFAFLSGLVTLFAPCIWPILPIVLSAGAGGGDRKPFGLVAGLATSFLLATLALASVIRVIPFDPDLLRTISVIVIALFGLMLLLPAVGAKLEAMVSRFASFGGRFTGSSGSGFWSGFVTGFALGFVWSPCAGPILATVATLAATQAINIQVFALAFAFVSGVAVPLFILAFLGRKILMKTRILSRYTELIQRIFGGIMILAALALYTGYDKTLQTRLLDTFPAYERFLNGLEKNDAVQERLDTLKESPKKPDASPARQSALASLGEAPDFIGIERWLNTDRPLSIADLRGEVVLVDFFTYSCINCIRTLPYVTGWYDRYGAEGLVVIGVHTPEFEFEKKTSNVENALKKYSILYPVAQDNDYVTWRAYRNRYWPAQYLIDKKGNIRRTHFGEGQYEETEQAIRDLLDEQ